MGAVGNKTTGGSVKTSDESKYLRTRTYDENDVGGITTFTNNPSSTVKWFNNPKMSNMAEWEKGLTSDQESAVDYYTGSGYHSINPSLYDIPWDSLSDGMKEQASNLFEAINKFELNKSINTVRRCDFQIFGASEGQSMSVEQVKNYLTNVATDGLVQANGFLSSTTNPSGTYAYANGLRIDFEVPPNKGGGAYVSKVGGNGGESEYLFNSNAVFQFDPNSVEQKGGIIHVKAKWVGQAKDQAFKKK